jgi:hypothetical protein
MKASGEMPRRRSFAPHLRVRRFWVVCDATNMQVYFRV